MSRMTRALLVTLGVFIVMPLVTRAVGLLPLQSPWIRRLLCELLLWVAPLPLMLNRAQAVTRTRGEAVKLLLVLLMLALGTMTQLAGTMLGIVWQRWTGIAAQTLQVTDGGILPTVFALCVVPAVAEELFFRAGLFSALQEKLPLKLALPIGTLIFALMHRSPASLPGLMLISLLLCVVWARYQDAALCIALHFSYNLSAIILAQLQNEMTVGLIGAALLCLTGGLFALLMMLRGARSRVCDRLWWIDPFLLVLIVALLTASNILPVL